MKNLDWTFEIEVRNALIFRFSDYSLKGQKASANAAF